MGLKQFVLLNLSESNFVQYEKKVSPGLELMTSESMVALSPPGHKDCIKNKRIWPEILEFNVCIVLVIIIEKMASRHGKDLTKEFLESFSSGAHFWAKIQEV